MERFIAALLLGFFLCRCKRAQKKVTNIAAQILIYFAGPIVCSLAFSPVAVILLLSSFKSVKEVND